MKNTAKSNMNCDHRDSLSDCDSQAKTKSSQSESECQYDGNDNNACHTPKSLSVKTKCNLCGSKVFRINRHMQQRYKISTKFRKMYNNKDNVSRIRRKCPKCKRKVVHLSEHLKEVHKISVSEV